MTGSRLAPTKSSPDELLGDLFADVQIGRLHVDGKTFVDLVPKKGRRKIMKAYMKNRQNPNFDLKEFVEKNFQNVIEKAGYKTNPGHTIKQHISELWPILTVKNTKNRGSLLALPKPYVVPGGRFQEQYYWDSYFTMLGLAASGKWILMEGMIKNFAYMIRKFGFIPTANRTYYLTRSDPPFFAAMVQLLTKKQGKLALAKYLPYLITEYGFWMNGKRRLNKKRQVYRRVVRMPDGSNLNRYFDLRNEPRPESFKEDYEVALKSEKRMASKIYLDIRAAAESGWDFSSRWLKDGKNLESIHTTDLIQIDLNCLLYQLETTMAEACLALGQGLIGHRYQQLAQKRKAAIEQYCWSPHHGFFFDYDFVLQERSDKMTLAGVYPLFVGLASPSQAKLVAKTIEEKFLEKGGLITTTLDHTGQQWDAPNGWAPLHWVAIKGLRNYGYNELADEIKKRWIATNMDVFESQHKLVEKYDVTGKGGLAGGGEYVLQDGFGWTNGVLLALLNEDKLK